MEGALACLYDAAVTAWPAITVSRDDFTRDLMARLTDDDQISALHTDVYLAIAATRGDELAARECDEIVAREVDFAAARLGATATQAADTRSELRRLMFTSDAERVAAIASFTGRGDLRGYARVIAARALARQIQRDRQSTSLDPDVLDLLDPALDPEVTLLRDQYREVVEAAFVAALGELTDRERAVLRYHLVDGWSIDELGARYRAHRATAARWLIAARAKLGAGIRSRLAAELLISHSQVDSIVALVTSRIEVSLERLLA